MVGRLQNPDPPKSGNITSPASPSTLEEVESKDARSGELAFSSEYANSMGYHEIML